MKKWFSRKTRKLRHNIAKQVAPGFFETARERLYTRRTILEVKKLADTHSLVGAEIGVAAGANAKNILETLLVKKLYLIDPYRDYEQDSKSMLASGFVDDDNVQIHSYADLQRYAVKLLKPFGSKAEFVVLESDKAANLIPSDLDFVYIDGNHDYEHVKADIANYYVKVRKGGIIGGDDFNCGNGVIQAVTEFAVGHGLRLMVDRRDWWIRK